MVRGDRRGTASGERSGVAARIQAGSIDDELNRMICEVIIGLEARMVVVVSEDLTGFGLRTIPAARDTVRERIPTWPVLVLRENHAGTAQARRDQ